MRLSDLHLPRTTFIHLELGLFAVDSPNFNESSHATSSQAIKERTSLFFLLLSLDLGFWSVPVQVQANEAGQPKESTPNTFW